MLVKLFEDDYAFGGWGWKGVLFWVGALDQFQRDGVEKEGVGGCLQRWQSREE